MGRVNVSVQKCSNILAVDYYVYCFSHICRFSHFHLVVALD